MMKKLQLLFTMLLLSLLGTGNAWAQDEIGAGTFDGKNASYTAGWSTTGTGVNRTDCVVIGSGENITSPAFDLSEYSEVTISIKARRFGSLSGSKATIDVAIGGTSVGTTDASSTNAQTTLEDIVFTPSSDMTAAVLVFTCTNATSAGSTHGAGINSITITGTKGSASNKKKATVTIDKTSIAIDETATVSTDGPALTLSTADATIASVSGTTVTGESAGSTTITASWSEDEEYEAGSKEFTITVTDPNASGTASNPYTVAEAIAYINTLGSASSPNDVYVSGIISQVDSYNSTYHSITYWISDNGTTSTQMQVYSGKGLDGADFSSKADLQVGDIVTVCGKVKMYNSTPEFDVSSKLVSFERPASVVEAPVFTPAGGTYTEAQSVEITCATENATIYYTIDGTDPTNESTEYTGAITVSATTTIKAIAYVGTDASQIVSAKYTIEVPGEVVIVEDDKTTFLFNTAANEWGFPTDKVVDEGEFTANGYTIKVAGTSGNGYSYYTGNKYLLMGRNGAYLTLPAFDFPVSKIEVVGRDGASTGVVQNIFVGEQAVSTATTGATGTNTYEIADGYQDAGNIYTLKVTSNHNTQITQIIVYKGEEPAAQVKYYVAGTWTNWGDGKLLMTKDSDGSFTLANQELENGAQFKIIKEDTDGSITWYGGDTGGNSGNYGVHSEWCTDIALTPGDVANFEIQAAKKSSYTFTLNPDEMTFSVTGWPRKSYYFIGQGKDDTEALEEMVFNEETGVYEYEYIARPVSDGAPAYWFAISDVASFTNWDDFNANHRYAAQSGDFELTAENSRNVQLIKVEGSMMLLNAGTYKLTLTEDLKLTVSGWPKPELEGNAFVKVTADSDLTNGYYLIVNEGEDGNVAFDGSLETLDAVANTIEVTITNDEIEATDANKASVFYIDTAAGTLQSASDLYIGVSGNDNGLKQTDDATIYTNSFSIDTDGNAVIAAVFEGSTMTLRYNKASNQTRFRYYKNNGQQPIQLYKLTTVEAPKVVVGARGAVSFSSTKALDFTNSDVEAYIVTEKNGSSFTKKQVTIVPANTGLVIEGAEGEYDLTVAAADAEFDNVEDNLLVATSTGEYTVTDETYGRVYGLFYSTTSNKLGFQKKKVDYTFGVDKCYLLLPEGSSAKGLEEFFFDDTTGIENAMFNVQSSKNEVYNLNGQRVDNNYKGVVIVNGKKVIKK